MMLRPIPAEAVDADLHCHVWFLSLPRVRRNQTADSISSRQGIVSRAVHVFYTLAILLFAVSRVAVVRHAQAIQY